ncbi:MAG: endonuclease [Alphaproteobacteria bacterium]|nr:endonuclease [Alphaproteobacteria bacterium]
MKKIVLMIVCLLASTQAFAKGNEKIKFFSRAKKLLATKVYYDHRETFYCKALYDEEGNVTLPKGFYTSNFKKRALRIEWEHVIPAENFGRLFDAWRNSDPKCFNENTGKILSNRKCVELVSPEFNYMEADMYNLYPAIGSVNAMRSNYRYTKFAYGVENTFGSCPMKIDARKVEPPEYTRGSIARTYLYFEHEYGIYKMSDSQRKLMEAWNKMYPVDEWECERAKRIESIQGNKNIFVSEECIKLGLY